MFEQICRVMLELGEGFSLSLIDMRKAFEKAVGSVRGSPYRLSEAVHHQTLLQLSDILAQWYRDPAWVDESGTPRPLAIDGPRSFASLLQQFLPQFEASDVAEILIKEGLLARTPNKDLFPLRRTASFGTPNRLMLDRIPVTLHALAGTYRHNFNPKTRRMGTHCDQGTTVDYLPVEAIPAFQDLVKILAKGLLNQVDEWGAECAAEPRSRRRQKLARVGVQVFTFADPQPSTPKPRQSR